MKRMWLTVGLTVLLAGCSFSPGEKPTPKWVGGSFVRSVLSKQLGQVIYVRCYAKEKFCYYDVRFIAPSMTTNAHAFGADDPVSTEPLSVVTYMREYELTDR